MTWQVPPNPVSVPQMTSSWATNGLKYSSASGGRRVRFEISESSRCAGWLGRNPLAVIDDQNTNRNVAPAVTTIVVTRLMTVAAWVRFTNADTNSPIEPKQIAVANRTT